MAPEEKQARLNLVRYGLFIMVIMAMVVTASSLYLATARVGQPLDVLPMTLMMTVAVAILAVVVYFAYGKFLDR